MSASETLHSFVNRWECDEVDHLNVQFYFARFEEADRQFRQITGLSEALIGARRVRHLRFHHELRSGDLLSIRTGIAFDGPHMLTVLHEMVNRETGEVCTTAIDGYDPQPTAVKTLRSRYKDHREDMPDHAAPRGLSATPVQTRVTLDELKKSGTRETFRGTVLPRHLSIDGRVDDAYAVGCFSEASPHIWQATSLTAARLNEINAGRVVLEMKLTWISPLKSGDMVVAESGLTQVQANTFNVRHHLFESRTNRLAAICDVVAVMLDKTTRKVVPLDELTRREMTNLIT
ncbi:acyl-CoA thioesterase [Roseibium limicola]|uniref:Thioesterase n=1 Tax=Roseibium limicola TaxID=2816037 RepID=A0A939EMG0_9HYPH|nr:thioesterase family protein [Roseibium limicola]MBO0345415.1 thioesterase [Roseibium limicola]